MIRRMRLELGGAHLDQRGANMFVTIAIMFGLLLLVPVFVDFASLHFSHRISQTGADTAAHAAAIEYALQKGEPYSYSQGFWGECGESPEEVAQRYKDEVVIRHAREGSLGYRRAYREAVNYARFHQSELERYKPYYPSPKAACQYPAGVEICGLAIYAKTRRPVPLIYESMYGGGRRAPAEALAEVYMNPGRPFRTLGPVPCDEGEWKHGFEFNWIVRLIEMR
jgi:hypothetical protein